MGVSFLLPAFLLGLAALAIPIIVHLTRKQRAKVELFPSLMFLERVPYQSENRRQIHHWFLLSLRALLITLLVLAFARPFFDGEEQAAASGSGPREVVILLDRSYSMGLEDRWSRAITAAEEVGAETTYLTHLTHRVRHEELLERLPAGVRPAYDGFVVEIE